MESDVPVRAAIRWWPAKLLLLLAGASITAIRFWPGLSFQERNLQTASACVITLVAMLVWAMAFSRMSRRARILTCGGAVAGVAVLATSVRIRGVSGDLLPILEWRYKNRPPSAAPPPNPPALAKASSSPSPAPAAISSYPQFLGPERNGWVTGPALGANWHAHPPEQRWQRTLGPAWSGFAIQGELAVTMEQRGDDEAVTCYDLASGQLRWSHTDPAHYHTTIAGEGPRTTPTIQGERVLTMGATGLLNCLELATGRRIWVQNVPEDNQGSVGEWGVSCSPLVVGNRVVVCTGAGDGRALAAYNLENGNRLWTGGTDKASYSSPVLANLGGSLQILSFNSRHVTAHDPDTGQVLWEHPWPSGHPHIATPLLIPPNKVLVSSGYGTGSELLQVGPGTNAPWHPQRLWKSNRLKSKFANLIRSGDYVYGLDDGILACLELATGRLCWKEGRYGHGQIIGTGQLLLIMAENGEVVLVQASPEAPRELTRFRALPGKTWNPPALAGRNLLVRNDLEAACYTLPVAATP